MKSFVNLEDGSNLTEISPILTCIHTLSQSDALWDSQSKCFKSLSLKQLKNEAGISREDGFSFAVSLRDGSCLYTSDAITYHLGYPNDMLAGQCIMNFLFQKDHITFANHLTQGLNACYIQGKRDDSHLVLNTFFCRLRMYHGLKFGYAVSDRKTQYKPFKITLHINELIVEDMCVEKISGTLCVKATAAHVSSAYSVPEEIPAMTSFSTRHTAACHFSHVDASAIPYLGYLPQDMIGFSVFDFYHIDDLPQLKEIYELVVKERGSSFRSKPYRFKVQNGCYVMLETEWSCFINPWSHKLEFVVGQHRVLKGPSEIDIFTPSEIEENILPDEIIKESQNIQKEIKTLLSQSIENLGANKSKKFCNKRKRDLAAFVYNCIDESFKENKQKGNADKQLHLLGDRSNSDPDSVVMGDISPLREVNDSNTSSETPPTVQQLRYEENIERFFASQPKTYSDGSSEYNKNEKPPSVDHSQGSNSASGNGSGKASTSKDQQSPQTTSIKNYENNQKLERNSSKCNMSSGGCTGDSGYGKSFDKDGANDPGASQTGSFNQMWTKTPVNNTANNMEKYSSCLSLTEETLSVHNRMNHKHSKQHRKSKTGLGNIPMKDNWFQQKDSGPTKRKKSAHTQTWSATIPTQTEDVGNSAEQSTFRTEPLEQKSVPTLQEGSVPTPSIANPFMFPPSNCAPTPTPFYIPVMYMGGMSFYPPTTNAPAHWPFGPAPPPTPSLAPSPRPGMQGAALQVPNFFNAPSGSSQPLVFNELATDENLNQRPGSLFEVQPSGVTSSIYTNTTTTVSAGTSSSYLNSVAESKNISTENENRASKLRLQKVDGKDTKTNQSDCDMQVDGSQSSSFTRSSSCQSADKDEDMDCEIKKCCTTPRSDRVQLSSEIAYRYQMHSTNMEDILKKDREALKSMQQPELVNQQLQMLQDEREADNEIKLKVDDEDYYITEAVMLGLAIEDDVNEELENREEYLLQLMCEDS